MEGVVNKGEVEKLLNFDAELMRFEVILKHAGCYVYIRSKKNVLFMWIIVIQYHSIILEYLKKNNFVLKILYFV